jgi:hypothetical protein
MDIQQPAFAEDLAEFQALADAAAVKTLAVVTGKLAKKSPGRLECWRQKSY